MTTTIPATTGSGKDGRVRAVGKEDTKATATQDDKMEKLLSEIKAICTATAEIAKQSLKTNQQQQFESNTAT
jgi:hypothetical protein